MRQHNHATTPMASSIITEDNVSADILWMWMQHNLPGAVV